MSIKPNTIAMPSKAEISLSRAVLLALAFGLTVTVATSSPLQAQNRTEAPPLITALGIGRPPADGSPTQARAMAERSAFLNAIREAAKKSGRAAPYEYRGRIKEGAVVKGFRITRLTRHPDGSVEIEVTVPPAGVMLP